MSLPMSIFDDSDDSESDVATNAGDDDDDDADNASVLTALTTPCPPRTKTRSTVASPLESLSKRLARPTWFLTKVQAVIIHTETMMLRGNLPSIEAIDLSSTDGVFDSSPASISENFAIPLVARKLFAKDRPRLRGLLCESQLPNLPIRSLFRNCDVTVGDTTAGPYQWDAEFGGSTTNLEGSVVLARRDKKALQPLHAEFVLSYVKKTIQPMMDRYQRERKVFRKLMDAHEYREKVEETRLEIAAEARGDRMRRCWGPFVDGKREERGSEWAWVQSPWDI